MAVLKAWLLTLVLYLFATHVLSTIQNTKRVFENRCQLCMLLVFLVLIRSRIASVPVHIVFHFKRYIWYVSWNLFLEHLSGCEDIVRITSRP